jgi:5-methylcytosine-specific restriction endonuclease McrA
VNKGQKRGKQAKRNANQIMMDELKRVGRPYTNMRDATLHFAARYALDIKGRSNLEAREMICSKIKGEDYTPAPLPKCKPKKPKQSRWNAQRYDADHVKIVVGKPTQADIDAFYKSWEWSRLSYEVKVERGRACECCGAKPPKVVIHTDHVKPIRFFWHLRLDKSNLQILCEDCNRGKGSHDMTDFRILNAEPDNKTILN